MSKVINSEQLWSMSNEQIVDLVKGKAVTVFMKDGSVQHAVIKNVSAGANYPHLFGDLLKSDGHWIITEDIDSIEILAE